MGKNGIFILLLVAVFSLALSPSLVGNSFAGTVVPVVPVVPAEICDDGIDNDGDGFIDLDDPDCHAIILKPTPGALPELPGFPKDPQPLLGDFKCYEAIASHPEEIALLQDQFQDEEYRILDVERVCNYIVKFMGEGFPGSAEPVIPEQHYKVYNIVDEAFEDDILLQDQWGTTRHTQLIATELWVPQEKIHGDVCGDLNPVPVHFEPDARMCVTDTPIPPSFCTILFPGGNVLPGDFCEFEPTNPDAIDPSEADIHWKCYDVPPKTPDTFFDVSTFDPNFNRQPVTSTVIQLDKICTPVKKSVCMEGYEFTPDGLCQDAIGIPTDAFTPIMFGDNTIPDHLTCYDIRTVESFFNGFNFGVLYAGQFQFDLFNIIDEREICLFASKIHVPETPGNGPGGPQVGGTFIPIDSTSLLLLVAQTTASWMIPVLVSAVGISLVFLRRK